MAVLCTWSAPVWAETGVTNTLNGATNSITGPYGIGTNGEFNAQIVTNGGVLLITGANSTIQIDGSSGNIPQHSNTLPSVRIPKEATTQGNTRCLPHPLITERSEITLVAPPNLPGSAHRECRQGVAVLSKCGTFAQKRVPLSGFGRFSKRTWQNGLDRGGGRAYTSARVWNRRFPWIFL